MVADMESDLIQPRDKDGRILQVVDLAQCLDIDFLNNVLCQKGIVEVMAGIVIDIVIGHDIQLGKSIAAAALGLNHKGCNIFVVVITLAHAGPHRNRCRLTVTQIHHTLFALEYAEAKSWEREVFSSTLFST